MSCRPGRYTVDACPGRSPPKRSRCDNDSASAPQDGTPDRTRVGVAGGRTLSDVSNPTSVLKRLLLGRPFRSDRLQHTLLPKRIALPVFASDALSSVAYAPDEILLTLSIAGAAAYLYSPWIALAVAVVMLTVVA